MDTKIFDINCLDQIITKSIKALIEKRQEDGGWGRYDGDLSDSWSTAQTMVVLFTYLESSQDIDKTQINESVKLGTEYLLSRQTERGETEDERYWKDAVSGNQESIPPTAWAIWAFCLLLKNEELLSDTQINSIRVRESIFDATNWLKSIRIDELGAWSTGRKNDKIPHIYNTCCCLIALAHQEFSEATVHMINSGRNFLLQHHNTQVNAWGMAASPYLPGDPTYTAYCLHTLLELEKVLPYGTYGKDAQRKVVKTLNWLTKKKNRNKDGSWKDYRGNESSIEATAYCIYVLIRNGRDITIKRIQQGMSFLLDPKNRIDHLWRDRLGDQTGCIWVAANVIGTLMEYRRILSLRLPERLLSRIMFRVSQKIGVSRILRITIFLIMLTAALIGIFAGVQQLFFSSKKAVDLPSVTK